MRISRPRAAHAVALALLASSAGATPELLVPAMEFGAKNCGFCHINLSGGEGYNERGAWLVAERDRRAAAAIDVAWLAVRDARVTPAIEPVAEQAPRIETLAPIERDPDSDARPFDYTTAHGDWPAYGGDLGARKYSPLAQIDADNVNDLRVAWVWDAFDNHRYEGSVGRRRVPDGFRVTPLMADGKLFVRTAFSAVAALDPITGKTLWTYDPGTGDGPRPANFGFSTRGLGYHQDAEGGRVLLLASDGWLIALSAKTGTPIPSFGANGRVDLAAGLRRPIRRTSSAWNYAPALCGKIVVVGNQPSDGSHFDRRDGHWQDNVPLGDVRGFDVHTGEQVWTFKTVPQAGEYGNDTWADESWRWMGNTNVWTMMSCDAELGHVYLPVSAPTSHFYGGLRAGDNLFGTSLVAVDARTGKRPLALPNRPTTISGTTTCRPRRWSWT